MSSCPYKWRAWLNYEAVSGGKGLEGSYSSAFIITWVGWKGYGQREVDWDLKEEGGAMT